MSGARWLAPIALLGLGCAELPELTAGTCGNGIVEQGEDCDTKDEQCRQPGDPLECRHDCSASACPSGWGCGVDGICRLATGEFETRGFSGHEITVAVATADFNADGRDDIAAAESSRTVVYYHDAQGRLDTVSTVGMFAPDMYPGQVTADEPVAAEPFSFVSALDSVTVARGNEDRSLTRVAYAPFDVDQSSSHYIAFDMTTLIPGDEIVGFIPQQNSARIVWITQADATMYEVPYVPDSTLALPADFDRATPCEELLLAAAGWNEVRLYPSCKQSGSNWEPIAGAAPDAASGKLPNDWRLPDPPLAAAARRAQRDNLATLADLNGDGLTDVIVVAEKPGAGQRELFGAYGVGNGTLHSDPSTIPQPSFEGGPIAAGDGQLKPLALSVPIAAAFVESFQSAKPELPLAVGAINGDTQVDFVSRTHIWRSDLNGSCPTGQLSKLGYCGEPLKDALIWSQAAIGDLNLDGKVDVVALPNGGQRVDFYAGVIDDDELFNRTEIHSIGLVQRFLLGDFDGDQVIDIALHENRGGLDDTASLAIAWGRMFGAPAPPVSVARFPDIAAMVAANFPSFETLSIDGIDDIGLISGRPPQPGDQNAQHSDLRAALFYGRGDRELQSPFQFIGYDARRAAVGRFDADAHADVACLLERQETGFTQGQPEFGLLLMPMSGAAQVSPRDTRMTPLEDPRISVCGGRAVAVDLDGDQRDELVAFGKQQSEWSGWGLVARAGDSGDGKHAFEITQLESTPELVFDGVVGVIACNTALQGLAGDPGFFMFYAGELTKGDLNGDGRDDVVALAYADAQALDRPKPELVLYPNHGTGALDFANRIRIELPRFLIDGDSSSGPSAAALAVMQADADPEHEVVVGNIAGAAVFDATLGPNGEISGLEPPRVIAGPTVGGGDFAPEDFLFASSAASGDIDGDGVGDLVLSGFTGVQVLYGIPVLR